MELCLCLFSPDPIGKVSKIFQKIRTRDFLQVPTEEEKTPNPHSLGYGAPDPQPRTPNVSADSFIGRQALDVSFCCEKGASADSYLHVPRAIQSASAPSVFHCRARPVRSDHWCHRQELRLTSCRIASYLRVTITVTLPVPLARLLSALPMMAQLAAALTFTRIA